jgi:ATP-binding protein involved in chromosome partitioning
MPEEASIVESIRAVLEPSLRRPIGELGLVAEAVVSGDGEVRVGLLVPHRAWPTRALGESIASAAKAFTGVAEVAVDVTFMEEDQQQALAARLKAGQPGSPGGPGSRTRVITVASGKGGVGKSSVTANLSVALAAAGHDVAVVDADVWGYSIPKMLGVEDPPIAVGQLIVPPAAHGVRSISMDYFVAPDQAVVWRGPMLHKALEQFLGDVYWDDPEFLLVDMPPGTGDASISLSQFLPRAEMLVVTTPQVTAQRVAKRAAHMATQVNQEIIGVVENMSWFTGDDGTRYELFGSGGGAALAEELGVELIGQVPLVPAMREAADEGAPIEVAAPGSEAALVFAAIAERIAGMRPRVRRPPELVIR